MEHHIPPADESHAVIRLPLCLPAGVNEVDPALVERVVAELNRVHAASNLSLARTTGEILLDAFFAGDLEIFVRIGKRHASLAAVLAHRGLHPSGSQTWYALNLLPQLRALGDELAAALPLRHHRILMHVRDEESKRALAERAAADGLSSRQLEHEVERWRVSCEDLTGRRRLGRPSKAERARRDSEQVQGTPAPAVDAAPDVTAEGVVVATSVLATQQVHTDPSPAGSLPLGAHSPVSAEVVRHATVEADVVAAPVEGGIEEVLSRFLEVVSLVRACKVDQAAIGALDPRVIRRMVEQGERGLGWVEEFLDDVGQGLDAVEVRHAATLPSEPPLDPCPPQTAGNGPVVSESGRGRPLRIIPARE